MTIMRLEASYQYRGGLAAVPRWGEVVSVTRLCGIAVCASPHARVPRGPKSSLALLARDSILVEYIFTSLWLDISVVPKAFLRRA